MTPRPIHNLIHRRGELAAEVITPAEKHTLPTYAQFATLAGIGFILTPTAVFTASPVYDAALWFAPIDQWGLVLTLSGLIMVWAYYVTSWRRAYLWGLLLFTLWMVGWSGFLVVGALRGDATWSGWLWAAAFMRLGVASLVSLQVGVTSRTGRAR